MVLSILLTGIASFVISKLMNIQVFKDFLKFSIRVFEIDGLAMVPEHVHTKFSTSIYNLIGQY